MSFYIVSEVLQKQTRKKSIYILDTAEVAAFLGESNTTLNANVFIIGRPEFFFLCI